MCSNESGIERRRTFTASASHLEYYASPLRAGILEPKHMDPDVDGRGETLRVELDTTD